MIATKVAVGVAILATGGTAVAAETGNLPAGVQHFFTALGVPAPDGGAQPTATGAGPAPSRGSATPTPSPTPSASRGGATSRPAETAALGLCRVWDDARQAHGKPMPAPSRRALAAAAGGEKRIADFCAGLLATSASATNSQPSTGITSTGSSPGTSTGSTGNNGNGNGNGNAGGNGNGNGNAGGNGNGNGNGNGKGQPSPIPTERGSHHS